MSRRRKKFSQSGCLLGGLFCGFMAFVFTNPTNTSPGDIFVVFVPLFYGVLAFFIGGAIFGNLMK